MTRARHSRAWSILPASRLRKNSKKTFPNLPESALRFALMFDAVSCVIPGASNARQAQSNAAASDAAPLSPAQMEAVRAVYDRYIRNPVQYLW